MHIGTNLIHIISYLLILGLFGCSTDGSKHQQVEIVEEFDFTSNTTSRVVLDSIYIKPNRIRNIELIKSKELEHIIMLMVKFHQSPEINFDSVVSEFKSMEKEKNLLNREYGIFGLMLIAYEVGDMAKMRTYLDDLDRLSSKSDWLENELTIYNILYYLNTADYYRLEKLLKKADMNHISDNPSVVCAKAWLYIRENKMAEAFDVLQTSKYETEDTIDMKAITLYYQLGIKRAVDYLEQKTTKYPESDYIRFLYNSYLFQIEPEKSTENLKSLVKKNSQNLFLQLQVAQFFANSLSSTNESSYNELLNRIDKSVVSKIYIDNSIVFLATSLNHSAIQYYLNKANYFNSMYVPLLWYKVKYSDSSHSMLNYLKKLEYIDPYNYSVLISLADYYKTHNMDKERHEIKQRFDNSPRYKTQEEISIMSQY